VNLHESHQVHVCTAATPRRRLNYDDEADQHQQQPAMPRIARVDVARTLAHAAGVIQQTAELVATSRLR